MSATSFDVLRRRIVLLGIASALVSGRPTFGADRENADARARIDLLLAAIGGRSQWARAHWLHVRERAYRDDLAAEIEAEYWRDLRRPRMWMRQRSPGVDVTVVWNGADSWRLRNGALIRPSEDDRRRRAEFWPKLIYTALHRLASDDPTLRSRVEGRRLFLNDAEDRPLCWFDLNPAGDIIKWSAEDRGEPDEHVYGPMRSFGAVRMPAWGARIDGGWRFYYESFELHDAAEPKVSLAPPGESA